MTVDIVRVVGLLVALSAGIGVNSAIISETVADTVTVEQTETQQQTEDTFEPSDFPFLRVETNVNDIKMNLDNTEDALQHLSYDLHTQKCSYHEDCELDNARCNNGTCQCQYGYYYKEVMHRCFKAKDSLSWSCSTDDECDVTGGEPMCVSKDFKCSCGPGYSYDLIKNECVETCSRWGQRMSATFHQRSVWGHNDAVVYGVSSAEDCAAFCLHDGSHQCLQVEWDQAGNKCQLSSTAWFDLTESDRDVTTTGWYSIFRQCGDDQDPYHMPCSDTANCPADSNFMCRNKECVCDVGYAYSISTQKCTQTCDRYGDTYTGHQNYGVSGYNSKEITVQNPQECMDACTAERTFECKQFEFSADSKECFLCDHAWYELPSSARTYPDNGWTSYFRNCK